VYQGEPPCETCPFYGVNERFAAYFGPAYGFWVDLGSTRPVGFGLGMIPAHAAAQYLALLDESRETLAKVLLIDRALYPHLVKQSESKEGEDDV